MIPERFRELISRGETMDVEFKGEERTRLSDTDVVEAVVCLTNRPSNDAGQLFIGVANWCVLGNARARFMSAHPKIWTTPNQQCTAPKIIQIYPKDSHLDAAFAANLKTLEYG